MSPRIRAVRPEPGCRPHPQAPPAEQAVEVILARVATGEWALGHRLPGGTALAAELGVGRSTVREAIRELAGPGILQARQGAGGFVLSTDAT
ncbi:winged helix-turn-helix domain-containing protein [Actinoallomurus acaciae]|uniref:Winged helix-turn-helix domain-containing protein n=1 Tax=Actinoallomurus acaciae TaxID=502577 RepID=A0ABV5YHV0_9ACTN